MSYNFAIGAPPIPADDKAAWAYINKLCEQPVEEALPVFHKLIDKLTEVHPCLCDLSDEEIDEKGVWSDGPLRNNIYLNAPILGLASSRYQQVMPFVIETANNLGLTVFDWQAEAIYRPSGH